MKKKLIAAAILTCVLSHPGKSMYYLEFEEGDTHCVHISYPTRDGHLRALNQGVPQQVRFFQGLDRAHRRKNDFGENVIFTFWLGARVEHRQATDLFIKEVNSLNGLNDDHFIIHNAPPRA